MEHSDGLRVGELAQRCGVTVRALRYYESIGLLSPARTASGHRRYGEQEIRRLYGVVALRTLGVPLDGVAAAIAGDIDLISLLRRQLAQVEQQAGSVIAARDQLRRVLDRAECHAVDINDLLDLIEETTSMDELVRQYFTDGQLDTLAQRRQQIGDEAIREVEAEWPTLIAQMQVLMEAGTDPTNPTAQRLAKRWMQLLAAFHGGDPDLRRSLFRMRAENAEAIQQQGGPSDELVGYVSRINAAAAAAASE